MVVLVGLFNARQLVVIKPVSWLTRPSLNPTTCNPKALVHPKPAKVNYLIGSPALSHSGRQASGVASQTHQATLSFGQRVSLLAGHGTLT